MLFNRKKKKNLLFNLKKKTSHSFPFFFVPVNRDEFKFCVYMGKNCPGKPGSRLFNGEISFCWDSFFSYKRNFIFGEIFIFGVSDEIPANRGPRLAGLEPGQFFSYKHPLRML